MRRKYRWTNKDWTPFAKGHAKEGYGKLVDTKDVYFNCRYVVLVYRLWSNDSEQTSRLMHLSIRRKDQEPLHDWRELQRIKNEICGMDCEGLEIYPSESRLTDCANQFHLWVLPPGFRAPVGFTDGRICSNDASFKEYVSKLGTQEVAKIEDAVRRAKQRPFEPHHGIEDLPADGIVSWDVSLWPPKG
jgi:hypothetical protein